MAYRRKRVTIGQPGRRIRRVRRVRGRGPKHPHPVISGNLLGSVFNTSWLFGRNRVYRRKGKHR
jgi:hypothetical protein